MKKLIVNADDFGLHENINNAIIEGHRKGCVTSTTLMAGAPAFEHAAALAAASPGLGTGVHLTLVGGRPVTEPDKIPSLVDKDGLFCPHYPAFLQKYCSGRIRLSHVRQELAAQVDKVLLAGIAVTHLDSHQHMHIVPGIMAVVIDIAKRFAIPAIRIPAEPIFHFGSVKPSAGRVVGRSGLSILAALARRQVWRAGLAAPDNFYGMLAGGCMEEQCLLTIIDNLPDGISEIMVHPGSDDDLLNATFCWRYHWQTDLEAVTSLRVADCLKESGISLVSYAYMNR